MPADPKTCGRIRQTSPYTSEAPNEESELVRFLKLGAFAVGVLAVSLQGVAASAATTVETVIVDGEPRSYRLHIPEGENDPMPLVISFHGFRSNAAQQEKLTGFSALADREKFIAAYPEGVDDKWRFAGRSDADVTFTLAIIDAVAAKASLDRRRIYASGISNGAEMSWRLACDAPDVFAAFGFVAGAYLEVCIPPPRPPLIIFHGTEDKILAYDGRAPFMPVRTFAARWAAGSGCNPPEKGEIIYQNGDATGERWRCQKGREVDLYSLQGKGHAWPGSAMPARITSKDVDATATMWAFFSEHARP
jgi:polyhydroxybutyrate depolymerase